MASAPHPSTVDLSLLQGRVEKLTSLLEIAKAMTRERDLDALLGLILDAAAKVVHADRASLWIVDRAQQELWTRVVQGMGSKRLRIPITKGIAGWVAQTGQVVNIVNAYADARFNKQVDRESGYRTRNILAVPMRFHDEAPTGVIQALNKLSGGAFDAEDEEILSALGANAAAAVQNAMLYEEIDRLFEGFVHASVTAIESRDPTTSGHSERVAVLTLGLAEQMERVERGPYAGVRFSRDELREIRYAALLHDFGKVGVRENVLIKERKLYDDEMAIIVSRFAVLRAQRENAHLRRAIDALRAGLPEPEAASTLAEELREIDGLLAFVKVCNQPTVLPSGGFEKLQDVARLTYHDHGGGTATVLSPRELERLSIARGSLDARERTEIESHVTHTFRFLSQIPWTQGLRGVPDIAHAHHEKLDGTGYPRKLVGDAIAPQPRMMAIADIYDALTARDRPYKPAVPHERAMDILASEAKGGKIDADLLEIFREAAIYRLVQQTPP
ncbi:MAG TPA: HD domain-containing phosphohydrolase [Myxococcota bacterium]|nr:HD domain-containing phosphohydrolase [Myxococcota bacterium]